MPLFHDTTRRSAALRRGAGTIVAGVAVALASAPAVAQTPPKLDTGDTAWMLTSTVLVLMMLLPGLALFYGGMVRKMNVLATLMQSFAAMCLISIIWFVIGYSLAFAEGTPFVGSLAKMFLGGVEMGTLSGTIPETLFFMFQLSFAAITPALIFGAVADRMRFSAMLLFSGAWSIVVYAPVAHMVWGPSGFLGGTGMTDYPGPFGVGSVLDFAGGTVVHINSGIAALVACLMIGKRKGYGREPFPPHNLTLTVIGASLLWVGWFGFNAGSAVTAGERAGMVMAVTHIATAGAGLAWMFVEWMTKGKPSVLGIASGAIAGLVAITPACGFVTPLGALIIGIVAGIVCYWACTGLKHALGYDDALDVFGIHGVGGIVGAILTGVFAVGAMSATTGPDGAVVAGTSGLIEGAPGQVIAQIVGVAVTVVWCAIASFVLLKIVDVLVGLRVDEEEERDGLDLRLHGETVP
ncbi:MAG: ammonium transporter [Alphaproteobacteria bacterium]